MGENPPPSCPICSSVSFTHCNIKGEKLCNDCGCVLSTSMEHSYISSVNDSGVGHGPFTSDVKPILGSSGLGLPRNLKRIQTHLLLDSEGSRAKRRARTIIKAVTYNGWRDGRDRALLCLERSWPSPDEKPEHPQFKDVYSIASCEGTQFAAVACVKIALDSMGASVPTSEYLRHLDVDLPLKDIRRFFLRTVKQVRWNVTFTDSKLRSVVQGSNLDFLHENSQQNRSQAIIDLATSRLSILDSIRHIIHKNVGLILRSRRLQSYHMKTIVSATIYHTAKQCNTMVTQQMICEALEVSNSFRTIRSIIAEIISDQGFTNSASNEKSHEVIA